MKVFIVGASGLVGSHCLKNCQENGWETIGSHLSFPTAETIYFDALAQDIGEYFMLIDFKPDVIIHCAALTNVDYCESHIEESYEKTVAPTERLASYCIEQNVKLVYVSTDYIFDGLNGPYSEDAPVNPLNIYGKHKLQGEQIVSRVKNNLIVRITNVYGEELRAKNFISRLLLNLENNDAKALNLPYDQFATPVYAGDIARMIFHLLSDKKCGIYNLSSTDYINRYQLAIKVKSYFINNKSIVLQAVMTSSSSQTALRPLNGGLLNIKFIGEYPLFQFTSVDTFILKSLKK